MKGTKKQRNSNLIQEIIVKIAQWEEIIPIGQLVVFFHSTNGLALRWGSSEDKHEKRNYDYFKSIKPQFKDSLIQAIVCGSFKPENFIHPFECYHTTSGYEDIQVLPEFFCTVDILAGSIVRLNKKVEKEQFLAFVYIYFLVIHPFVDGNGRVARNLLDYYNQKMSIGLKPVWNNQDDKKFSNEEFHKEAFSSFFKNEVKLLQNKCNDIYSYEEIKYLLTNRKVELLKLSQYMISELMRIKSEKKINSISIKTMAEGIRALQ